MDIQYLSAINIYQIFKVIGVSRTIMNYFPNFYFNPNEYHPLLRNTFIPLPDNLTRQQDLKYIQILQSENKLLREKVEGLELKLKSYEKNQPKILNSSQKKKTGAKQTTNHKCPYLNCERNYKSNLALNLHMKIKHNGGSIRERQAYAKLLLECERDKKPKPEISINFPPNFIENYRKKMEMGLCLQKEGSP